MAFSTLRVATQAAHRTDRPGHEPVTVHPGETLWQIARRVAPGDDTRDTVLRIRDLNALDSASSSRASGSSCRADRLERA